MYIFLCFSVFMIYEYIFKRKILLKIRFFFPWKGKYHLLEIPQCPLKFLARFLDTVKITHSCQIIGKQ